MACKEMDDGDMLLVGAFLIKKGRELIFDTSSDEDVDMYAMSQVLPRRVPKITVPKYNFSDFEAHFRFRKETFEAIMHLVVQWDMRLTNDIKRKGRKFMDLPKRLLIFLWIVATQDSFRSVAARFDSCKATVHNVVHSFSELLARKAHTVITLPRVDDVDSVCAGFRTTAQFPDVFGAIDSTHISICRANKPREGGPAVNSKSESSIVLQAICDDKMIFKHCYIEQSSAVHDAQVLRRSKILPELSHFEDAGYHLLGDAAYPVSKVLITPFEDLGQLTEKQQYFNECHAMTHLKAERAFGMLKGVWQRMKSLSGKQIDKHPQLVVAACVLHNIRLSYEDCSNEEFILVGAPTHDVYNMGMAYDDCSDEEFPMGTVMLDETRYMRHAAAKAAGEAKRHQIMEFLWSHRM